MDIEEDNVNVDQTVPIVGSTEMKARWYHYMGDFFNTLKAFIGTNYLALGFAFKQSGFAFGLAGVLGIACLTDHCCQMMVRCKYFVIDIMVTEKRASGVTSHEEIEEYKHKLANTIGYGDLGKIALGKWGSRVIDFAVFITQYLCCVAYFIFIADTMSNFFPMEPAAHGVRNCSIPITANETTFNCSKGRFEDVYKPRVSTGIPMLNIVELKPSKEARHDAQASTAGYSFMQSGASIDLNTSMTEAGQLTLDPSGELTITTSPSITLLCLAPLLFFIVTSFVRRLRMLSPLTIIASAALFTGAISVLAFLATDFTMAEGDLKFHWYKWQTLPIFLGQLISAYEGIGCILPIESSMEGTRKAFPMMLRISVYLVFCILASFGCLGYLRYGEGVNQLITDDITQHTPLAMAVDVTLIISVLFTYPLQCFPVILLVEKYFLSSSAGSEHGESRRNVQENDENEPKGLLDSTSSVESNNSRIVIDVPPVAEWKRNILRIVLTLSIMGCAMLLWNAYAYIGAISGALGASLLAYILPCLIHLKIKGRSMRLRLIIKDLLVIFFSTAVSILVIVVIIMEISKGEIQV